MVVRQIYGGNVYEDMRLFSRGVHIGETLP
jgi:hypothetical protein